MSSAIVLYYRDSRPSGLDWAVQRAVDSLVSENYAVTLIVPRHLDTFSLVDDRQARPSTPTHIIDLPDHTFAFKNRILLLHEVEKVINRTSSSLILSFGAHHCGYTGALAAQLQNVRHACVFTYRDMFEYHLNTPQEFELILQASYATASFNERVALQMRVFSHRSVRPPVTLEPPEPSDLMLFKRTAIKTNTSESHADGRRFILTCGSLSSMNNLSDIIERATEHLYNVDQWIHAGILESAIIAPFCSHLAKSGLLDRFSVLGVLERSKFLSILDAAEVVLLSQGEHDTGILERECALLGTPVDSAEHEATVWPTCTGSFDGDELPLVTRLSLLEFIAGLDQ